MARDERHLQPPLGEVAGEVRCGCGSLLARVSAAGVELKCRRCRRFLVVSQTADGRYTIRGSLLWSAGSPPDEDPTS
jgi:phage FluMu protein Com